MGQLIGPQERLTLTIASDNKSLGNQISSIFHTLQSHLIRLSEDDSRMEYILGFVHLNGWEDTAKSGLGMNLSIRQREIFITHLLYIMISTYYTNYCNGFTAPLSVEVRDGDFRKLHSLFLFSEKEFRNAIGKVERSLVKERGFLQERGNTLPKIEYL